MLAATRRSHQISFRYSLMMCTIYVNIQAVSSLEGSLPTTEGFTKHKTYVVYVRKTVDILFVNKGETNYMQQLVILLLLSCSSTCFGRLYVHHQEVRLRFTAYGFL
jgi:hypothetical protein